MELRSITPRVSDGEADADSAAWTRAMLAAFLRPRIEPELLARAAAGYAGQRLRGCYADGDPAPVATLRSWDTRMTVPGGDLAAAAVTSVGVRASHRRAGLMRRLLTEDLEATARAGTPVAALTSTQGSLYERFGFGLATWTRRVVVDTAAVRFREPAPRGRIEMVTGPEALAATAGTVHERARRRHPGALALGPAYWSALATGSTAFSGMTPDRLRHGMLWRDDDGLLGGYAVFRVARDWGPTGQADCVLLDLQATTPQAYRELWRAVCGHDLVGSVRFDDASVDEPLPWLLADHRAVAVQDARAMTWLRVLDLPAALGARTYPVADVVRVQVHDRAGYAAGRWALDTTDPTAPHVARLGPASDVDAETDASGLASLYLGGADPRVLARAGRLSEHTPGAAGRLARLFSSPSVPWNGVRF